MKQITGILSALALLMSVLLAIPGSALAASTITFGQVADVTGNPITLGAESYVLAGDAGGAVEADHGDNEALFYGYHETEGYDYWGGYGVSNRTVVAAGDSLRQYTVWGGTDHTATSDNQYAIAYDDWYSGVGAMFELLPGMNGTLGGAWFNNIVWTYEYMRDYYEAGDYYHLTVTAYDSSLDVIDSAIVDLTMVDHWIYQEFGWTGVYAVGITMDSSDYMTPNYFAMDDVNAIPVPGAVWLLGSGLVGILSVRKRLFR